MRLYQTAPTHIWASASRRNDQKLVRALIRRLCNGGDILDVGCYTGELLGELGDEYRKFAVEPSSGPAEVARLNGISVIAKTLDDVCRTFDVVCAVDVIEHVANPMSMLESMTRVLRPGGAIIVSTGNASCRAWQFFEGLYWYCGPPEHISFLSPSWASKAATNLGLSLEPIVTFNHITMSPAEMIRAYAETAARILLATAERATKTIRIQPLGPRFNIGKAGLFRDHFLAVLHSP